MTVFGLLSLKSSIHAIGMLLIDLTTRHLEPTRRSIRSRSDLSSPTPPRPGHARKADVGEISV